MAAFQALPQITDVSDFHCVSRWSQLDMEWQGILAQHVLAQAAHLNIAKFITLHGYDGCNTNIVLEAMFDNDVFFAHSVLGAPHTRERGGPVRMEVPKHYIWKSAKWLKAIELHDEDKPGFWEKRGYHNYAVAYREERFIDDKTFLYVA